jgi:glyoxylase-like metal-dependent hydrolase (beta-lactamase superfamily II)
MAKLILQQIAGNTYYIPAPANIGVYVHNQRAILIDSGNDKDAGRQIFKLLKTNGWTLELIINTHSNADHIGGNAYLQQKIGCRIAATPVEAAFIEQPTLEPAFLFGGFPMPDLQNKFLMARPSQVTDRIAETGPIAESGLEAFPLPGHFFQMIGVRTPDDVVFLADSLFAESIVQKYHIFFLYDVQAHLHTLAALKTCKAAYYLPSHAALLNDPLPLIDRNIAAIQANLAQVLALCQEPQTFETLLTRLCQTYQITLDANQYVLVGSTLKSYLSYLLAQEKVETQFVEGRLLWQRADEAGVSHGV